MMHPSVCRMYLSSAALSFRITVNTCPLCICLVVKCYLYSWESQVSLLFVSTHDTRELPEVLRAARVSRCEVFCSPAHCRHLISGYFQSWFSVALVITMAAELDWAQPDSVVCKGRGGVAGWLARGRPLLMGSSFKQDVKRSFCCCFLFIDLSCN